MTRTDLIRRAAAAVILLGLADTTVHLQNVDVYRIAIRDSADNYLFCNVGQDVVQQFHELVINLRSMSLLLR